MTKKTIAFVIGSLSAGGAERVISTLSNELVQNYRVLIITFVEKTPFYALNEQVEVIPCQTSVDRSTNIFQRLNANYYLYQQISKILKNQNADVCIGFLPRSNILSILASKAIGIPVIICERNDPKSVKKQFLWDAFRKYTYPKANHLVVQTEEIRQFFLTLVDSSKLHILPNPLSPEFKNKGIEDHLRANIILNVGRLTNQKGQRTLISAFSQINPPNWKLVIVGEGENRSEYEQMIKDFEMEEKNFLPGRLKNISDYYNDAKIFAFTSLYEGFPNALIEAMHMGLPSISTDCPTGPSELISDGINGFLVELGDDKVFTEKLNRLVENVDLRKEFSELGSNAVQRFSVQNVVREWEKIISASFRN